MKISTLPFFICPRCNTGTLACDVSESDPDSDLLEGNVTCGSCAESFPIRDGILDLHVDPTAAAQAEMDGHVKLNEIYTDDDMVPEHLRAYVTGERAQEVQLQLPRCEVPELVEKLEAFTRLSELADDYFELLDWLHLQPGDSVLEVGSAACWSARHLAERAGTVIATDVSHTLMYGQAIVNHGIHLDRAYADMTRLPVRDGVLDLVFGVACIHHADDLRESFETFERVLKSGGKAVFFEEPVVGENDPAGREAFGAEEKALGLQEHIYTMREYFDAARSVGLQPRVVPLQSLFKDSGRNWTFVRKLGLLVLRSPWGKTGMMTRMVYPWMLRYYPRIPFPRFALVLDKPA